MDNKQTFKINLLDQECAQAVGEEILKKLEKGMTLQEATGVSEEVLEEIYGLAFSFYEQGKYRESLSLFQFLAGASPTTYKYVLGLASSYHQIGAYEDAALGFYIACNLEPENPLPAYYVTDCFLQQDLHEEAEEFAEIAIMMCGDRPEYSNLKHRCELIHQSLKAKNNKES